MRRTNFSQEKHKEIFYFYLGIKARGVTPVVRWTRIGDEHPNYCHNGFSRYIKQEDALKYLEEQYVSCLFLDVEPEQMDIYPDGITKQT